MFAFEGSLETRVSRINFSESMNVEIKLKLEYHVGLLWLPLMRINVNTNFTLNLNSYSNVHGDSLISREALSYKNVATGRDLIS